MPVITWTPEQEQIIYREWGLFYTKQQHLDIADLYYNRSLDINPDDAKALHFRSQCKRHIAQTAGALADAKRALVLDDLMQPYNLEVCDCIYELNEFEEAKYSLVNNSRKFTGKKVQPFNLRTEVVEENFKASLGRNLGHFIIKNGKIFTEAYSDMIKKRTVDLRPLWKIMKSRRLCDCLSVIIQEKKYVSPKECARKNRAYHIFNQLYLGRSWIDLAFLKTLKTDTNLLLPQSKLSNPLLKQLTQTKYDVVQKLLKMLYARSPLYHLDRKNRPNRRKMNENTTGFLFRVQRQVHRNMLKMLKAMQAMRNKGQLRKLTAYVEEVMGDYVVLKIHRIMPWKFKFANEVYNILALALCDQYEDISQNLRRVPQRDRLTVLLKVKAINEKEPPNFEFGNRTTYQDLSLSDKKSSSSSALKERLKKRLKFAKYPIERAYLWYEIARANFKECKFDRCCLLAERSTAEARKCNSLIWVLHSTMLQCKTHAVLRKVEKLKHILKDVLIIAKNIGDEKILNFILVCIKMNKVDLADKKAAEVLRSKSKISLGNKTSEMNLTTTNNA